MSIIPKDDWEQFQYDKEDLCLSNTYHLFLTNNYSKLQLLITKHGKEAVYNVIRQEFLDKNQLIHHKMYQNFDSLDHNIEEMFVDIFQEHLSLGDLLHSINQPELQKKIVNLLKDKKINILEELKKMVRQNIEINFINPKERDKQRINLLLNFTPIKLAFKGEGENKIIDFFEDEFNLYFPQNTNILFSNSYLYMIEYFRGKIAPNEQVKYKNENFINYQLNKKLNKNIDFLFNKLDLLTVMHWLENYELELINKEYRDRVIKFVLDNEKELNKHIWAIDEETKLDEIVERFKSLNEKNKITDILDVGKKEEIRKI